MNIKAIVTDLDRTLLHTDKTLSDYTVTTLNEYQQNGIKLIFATARPIRTVKPFISKIKADSIAYHNGAVVYINNKEFCKSSINLDTTKNILMEILNKQPKALLSIEIDDIIYANFDLPTNFMPAIKTDFTDLPNKLVDKIIVKISSIDILNEIAMFLPDNLYIEATYDNLGLIMNKEATKLNAIKSILKYWNIDLSEVVAFGDDFNDIKMIQECGIGVAVNNGIDEVKSVADYICDSNDNDGVAKWLKDNLQI